jgi:MFS family permease
MAASHSQPAPPSQTARAVRGGIFALVLLTLLNLLNYLDRYVLPAVQPLIQKEFTLTDAQTGALSTAFFFVYMLAAPLTGWLGDRYPRKPLLIAGAFIWSGATLLTATVHSYHMLYLRHAIVGIGEASFCIYAPALLADYFPGSERNRVLSIFYVAIPVGAALGYLTGGWISAAHGWRAPFYVAGIPGFIVAMLLFFLREPKRGASDSPAERAARENFAAHKTSVVRTLALLFRNHGYLSATLGMAMMTFSIGGIAIWIPTFLYRHGGYSLEHAGFILSAVTAVDGILGTAAGGWLGQRWLRRDPRALYLLSAWSMLLAIPGALVAFFGPHWAIVPGIAASEFFLFLNTGPLNTAIVNSVGAGVRATALSLELFLIHALGDVPSPKLIGIVSDYSSLRVGLSLTMVAMVASASLIWWGRNSARAPFFNEIMRVAPK